MYYCPRCMSASRSFLRASALAMSGRRRSPSIATTAGDKPARTGASGTAGKIIDFHTHMSDASLPNILPVSKNNSAHTDAWLEAMRSPTLHVEHMDRRGIDVHVVGYSNAVHGISWGDAHEDLERYRRTNDRIASEWIAAHPDRFHGAFGVPTQDLRLAIPELERAVTQLGMKVLQVSSCTADGLYYGDPRLDPFWEAVQHFDVTVFIHPHGQENKPPFDDFALDNSVGQGVEEVKTMTSIIYNGVFEKFPKVKIVVAHGGGFLPHYYGRMDRNARERPHTVRNMKRLPSEYLKSFYYDSCVYGPEILAALIKVVGVERVVLGTDFPVGEDDGLGVLRAAGLQSADIALISSATPSALIGLTATHSA